METMMKYILTGFVLMCAMATSCRAGPLLIFGDSLSSGACAWPQVFSEYNIAVQVQAQPGRMLMEWNPPSDLYPFSGSRVVIWMGSNDAIWGVENRPNWIGRIKDKVAWIKRRFGEVIIILPPQFEVIDTEKVRELLSGLDATIIDPVWWSDIETGDGVHPTCEGHRLVAYHLFWELAYSE
jgi:hypothetical protein